MDALKNGDITDEAFLNRLTFHESKVCDGFAEFPDDDWLEDDLDESAENAENTDTANQPVVDLTICPTCNERKRECILLPCRHLYFCSPCYEKWSSTDPATFDNIDLDGNIISPVRNVPPEEVQCPICKQPVENVITPLIA